MTDTLSFSQILLLQKAIKDVPYSRERFLDAADIMEASGYKNRGLKLRKIVAKMDKEAKSGLSNG